MKPKLILLFSVTIALFYLLLVPIIYPFTSPTFTNEAIGFAYGFWYIMIFILTLCWGHVVVKNGCWFFKDN